MMIVLETMLWTVVGCWSSYEEKIDLAIRRATSQCSRGFQGMSKVQMLPNDPDRLGTSLSRRERVGKRRCRAVI